MVAESVEPVETPEAFVETTAVGPALPGTCVTVCLNDMPMRFYAPGLREGLQRGVDSTLALVYDDASPVSSGKMKALIFALKQAIGLLLPLLGPMVAMAQRDEHLPEHVRRILPSVPPLPRHADKLHFLLSYLADVLHNALTENEWVIDVEGDPETPVEDAFVKVAHFGVREPGTGPESAEA